MNILLVYIYINTNCEIANKMIFNIHNICKNKQE